jgi:dTDP-4-dehydrorhamnose reductase
MKVVVTGAGGMLGRAVMAALDAAGHPALGLTRADADVTRPGSLAHPISVFKPDWLFHLAAFTRVDECETHADHAYLVNVLGARHAALAAMEARAAVLAVSTDYVFDGASSSPYREYDTPAPLSVYGGSKLAGERAMREVHPLHVIVRTSWLFGRGGGNFVDTIAHKAWIGDPLSVVDDQRGSPTSTTDLAGALVCLAGSRHYGTYHCTNGGDCTWFDLAEHVVARGVGRGGARVPVTRTTTEALGRPARRPAYSVLNNQLYEHVTGHRMPPWRDAVDRHLRETTSERQARGAGGAES